MKKYRIGKSLLIIMMTTLIWSAAALAASPDPSVELVETENKDQYKITIHNWNVEANSLQFDLTVDQEVPDYTMEWADKAESSYQKVIVKKEPKKTIFTFYADKLSPISEGDTAELGLFTIKGLSAIPKFTTSGEMIILDENVNAASYSGVAVNVKYNDRNHNQETEKPVTPAETEKPQETEKPVQPARAMTLHKSSVSLYLKDSPKSITLKAYLNKKKLSGSSVTWKTSNKKVATVKNGKVSAVSKGIVTIKAVKDGLTARCRVKVKQPTISLNSKSVTIYNKISTRTTLSATVNGVKVSGNKVKWTTSDSKTATVKNGKVKAKKTGRVTITATANGKKAKCTVNVSKPSLEIKTKSIGVKKGKTVKLKVYAKPNKKIVYKSDDKTIASVSKNGQVEGIRKGNTIIRVSCNGLKKVIPVTVK